MNEGTNEMSSLILKQLEDRLSVTNVDVMQLAFDEITRLHKELNGAPQQILPWMECAKKYIGLREIPGNRHNPQILRWWVATRQPFTDDETPWCSAAVGGVFEEKGIISTRKANARSWNKWGSSLPAPAVGAVVVFWRGSKTSWKGHVGIVWGKDTNDNLIVWGGNQGNQVSLKAFPRKRVLSYRWPQAFPLPHDYGLPILTGDLTNGEA